MRHLLLFSVVLRFWFCVSIVPQIRNSSHEIYIINGTFTNTTDIECISPNCLIQCISNNACNAITVSAVNIHSVEIICYEYNSCNNIEINANNETNANINCLYAHSCAQSIIYTFNSFLSLQCNQQHSCKDMDIIINKPSLNAVDLFCNADDSCKNLEIQILSMPFDSDSDWLTISGNDGTLNVAIFCDDDSNTTTLHRDQSNNIQCSDNIHFCCPATYLFMDPTSFYSTEIENTLISTLEKPSYERLFEYFSEYVVPLFYICLIYTSYVIILFVNIMYHITI